MKEIDLYGKPEGRYFGDYASLSDPSLFSEVRTDKDKVLVERADSLVQPLHDKGPIKIETDLRNLKLPQIQGEKPRDITLETANHSLENLIERYDQNGQTIRELKGIGQESSKNRGTKEEAEIHELVTTLRDYTQGIINPKRIAEIKYVVLNAYNTARLEALALNTDVATRETQDRLATLFTTIRDACNVAEFITKHSPTQGESIGSERL
jgi:hypothetical protein